MTRITVHKVILALLLCAGSVGAAEFRVANVFQDHMVLQRDKPIKIWGWSTTGDKATVSFAGQTKTATADKDGKWMITLDALPASCEGRELRVQVSGFSVQDLLFTSHRAVGSPEH